MIAIKIEEHINVARFCFFICSFYQGVVIMPLQKGTFCKDNKEHVWIYEEKIKGNEVSSTPIGAFVYEFCNVLNSLVTETFVDRQQFLLPWFFDYENIFHSEKDYIPLWTDLFNRFYSTLLTIDSLSNSQKRDFFDDFRYLYRIVCSHNKKLFTMSKDERFDYFTAKSRHTSVVYLGLLPSIDEERILETYVINYRNEDDYLSAFFELDLNALLFDSSVKHRIETCKHCNSIFLSLHGNAKYCAFCNSRMKDIRNADRQKSIRYQHTKISKMLKQRGDRANAYRFENESDAKWKHVKSISDKRIRKAEEKKYEKWLEEQSSIYRKR